MVEKRDWDGNIASVEGVRYTREAVPPASVALVGRATSIRHFMKVQDMKLALSSLRRGVLCAVAAFVVSGASLASAAEWGVAPLGLPSVAALPPSANCEGVLCTVGNNGNNTQIFIKLYKDGAEVTNGNATGQITINGGNYVATLQTVGQYSGFYQINVGRDLRDQIDNGAQVTFDDLNKLVAGITATFTTTKGVDPCGCPTEEQIRAHSVTANGTYGCAGDQDTHLQTSGSYEGVTYRVYKDGQEYQFATTAGGRKVYSVVGNPGNQPLRFFVSEPGVYTVQA